jgi:hypothetical protein
MRKPRPTLGTVLGGLALFVAMGGTAMAATGTVVNIADGTTATNLAKVDATGALRTSTAGTTVVRATPSPSFDAYKNVPNFNGSATRTTMFQSAGTLALTRINYSPPAGGTGVWEVYVRYAPIPAGGTCDAFNSGSRQIARATVPASSSYSDTFPSPLVLKPAASGQQWCLVASAGVSGSSGSVGVDVSGIVVSGAAPVTPSRRQPDRSSLDGR